MDKNEIFKGEVPIGLKTTRNPVLPAFVLADIEIYRKDFIKYLQNLGDDVVRFQVKETLYGEPYTVLNTWSKWKPKSELIIRKINKE